MKKASKSARQSAAQKRASKTVTQSAHRTQVRFEELEPRFLMSAQFVLPPPHHLSANLMAPFSVDQQVVPQINWGNIAQAHQSPAPVTPAPQAPLTQAPASQLIIVDGALANVSSLVQSLLNSSPLSAGASPAVTTSLHLAGAAPLTMIQQGALEIVVLDPASNGITQISALLASQHGLDAIQLISHGASGALQLGNTQLNGTDLSQYSSQIAQWGNALRAGGDLMLYGCNVAEGATGIAFVQNLAGLTHAGIAASDRPVGNVAGASWTLDYVTAAMSTSGVQAPDWNGILASVNGDPGGNSTLQGVNGDTLFGAGSNNSYIFTNGWGTQVVVQSAGQSGNVLDFSAVTSSLAITVAANGTSVKISDGSNTVFANNIQRIVVGSGPNTIIDASALQPGSTFTANSNGSVSLGVPGIPGSLLLVSAYTQLIGNSSTLNLSAYSSTPALLFNSDGSLIVAQTTQTFFANGFTQIVSNSTAAAVLDTSALTHALSFQLQTNGSVSVEEGGSPLLNVTNLGRINTNSAVINTIDGSQLSQNISAVQSGASLTANYTNSASTSTSITVQNSNALIGGAGINTLDVSEATAAVTSVISNGNQVSVNGITATHIASIVANGAYSNTLDASKLSSNLAFSLIALGSVGVTDGGSNAVSMQNVASVIGNLQTNLLTGFSLSQVQTFVLHSPSSATITVAASTPWVLSTQHISAYTGGSGINTLDTSELSASGLTYRFRSAQSVTVVDGSSSILALGMNVINAAGTNTLDASNATVKLNFGYSFAASAPGIFSQGVLSVSDGSASVAINNIGTIIGSQLKNTLDFSAINAQLDFQISDLYAFNVVDTNGAGNTPFLSVTGVQNLVGATASGSVAALNTLDYSAYTGDVNVNLVSGQVSGFDTVSAVQNIIGSASKNTITGDAGTTLIDVFSAGGNDTNSITITISADPVIVVGGGSKTTVTQIVDANITLKDGLNINYQAPSYIATPGVSGATQLHSATLNVDGVGTATLLGIGGAVVIDTGTGHTLDASLYSQNLTLIASALGGDTLMGGTGPESDLTGTGGVNTLMGATNAAATTFAVESGDGNFQVSTTVTKTVLSYTPFDPLQAVLSDTLINVGNLKLTATGINNAVLDASGFNGNTILIGNVGADILKGATQSSGGPQPVNKLTDNGGQYTVIDGGTGSLTTLYTVTSDGSRVVASGNLASGTLDVSAGVSSQQTITMDSHISGGSFDLGYTNSAGSTVYTTPIAWNATAQEVSTALDAVTGGGNVAVIAQSADFTVHLADGSVVKVSLAGDQTLDDVISDINSAQVKTLAGNLITPLSASIAANGASLVLIVTDPTTGSNPISINAVQNSAALADLGLLGTVATMSTTTAGTVATFSGSKLNYNIVNLTGLTELSTLINGFSTGLETWTVQFTGTLAGLVIPILKVANATISTSNNTITVQSSVAQNIVIDPSVDGGQFALSVTLPGSSTALTTGLINSDAQASDVFNALVSAGVSADDIIVSATDSGWQVAFLGSYIGNANAPLMQIASGNTLTINNVEAHTEIAVTMAAGSPSGSNFAATSVATLSNITSFKLKSG